MAKRRKKKQPQPVVMPKTEAEKNRIVVTVDPTKVAMGHRPHTTGSGAHLDRRTKRNRTRAAQKRNHIGEW